MSDSEDDYMSFKVLVDWLRHRRRHGGDPELGRPLRRAIVGEQDAPAPHRLHQRAAARARARVPRQEVPLPDRAQPDRVGAAAQRGPGEDLVPEPARQVETGEGGPWHRAAPGRQGRAAEEQAGGAHTGAREPVRCAEPAPAAGESARRPRRPRAGQPRGPQGGPGPARVPPAGAAALGGRPRGGRSGTQ